MENETKGNIDWGTVGVGQDRPPVSPKPVVITSYRIEPVIQTTDNKKIGDKLVLVCSHPDQLDRPIEISSVKYESKSGGKSEIRRGGLWVKLDSEGKIPSRSALACLLKYTGKDCIKDLVGLSVQTTLDGGGYLVVKAY